MTRKHVADETIRKAAEWGQVAGVGHVVAGAAMQNEKKIVVYGTPIGQPRARASVVGGRARMYSPTKHPVSDYRAGVRMAAGPIFDSPLEGPVGVSIVCVFPRPKSMIWKKRPMPAVYHTGKPDGENVAKAVLDALTGTAWRDDSQVSVLRVTKWVASGEDQPRTEIVIYGL